jgi:hypothetical protein
MITFTSKSGVILEGEIVKVPGFEMLDFIFVQHGFLCKVYELATGMEVIFSQGFSHDEVIADLVGQFSKKNISDHALLSKIYGNQHQYGVSLLKVINESPAYERYRADRDKAKAEAPYIYNEADRARIGQMLAIARKESLPNITILESQMNARINPGSKNNIWGKIDNVERIFENSRKNYHALLLRISGKKLPAHLRHEYKDRDISVDEMITSFNELRKRDITRYIPSAIFERFYDLWSLCWAKNNEYGYKRFSPYGMTDLIRLTIDLRKKRDVEEDIADINKLLDETYLSVLDETQPYEIPAHEAYATHKNNLIEPLLTEA